MTVSAKHILCLRGKQHHFTYEQEKEIWLYFFFFFNASDREQTEEMKGEAIDSSSFLRT